MNREEQFVLFDDMPETPAVEAQPQRRRARTAPLRCVAIDLLDPDPGHPRRVVDEPGLEALAATLRETGLLQPLLVRPAERGRFVIVDGHRRWRAATLAGLAAAPVIVRAPEDPEEIQLVLHLHHARLGAVDEAVALAALADRRQGGDGALAARLGIDPSRISRARLIAALGEDVKALARARGLSAGVLTELASPALGDADRDRLLALPPDALTRQAVRAAIEAKRAGKAEPRKASACPRQAAARHIRKAVDAVLADAAFTEQDVLAMTVGAFLALAEGTGPA